ncbi:sensor domain-containing diguanylate cyclase [Nostoc sp. LEGE 06077]|uniref:sensor domain-containing diguanylate cyclase n=1 Tax=Nostoc sp. LEGE 06077 TaxID=915325 RepID=UPI0018830C69|nr:sensor domain-containing diguanylate cyclase [Nostoc sp. LEGE 06077]MBE9206851.1 sensor domain-containing diguanylate cyclase [Nostoc sp. LEGE 06077]
MLNKILHNITKLSADLFCKLLGQPSVSDLKTQLYERNVQIQQLEQQEKALYKVISKIRASLELETIFRTATKETCKLLRIERIAVYRFYENWGGEFVSDFEFAELGWDDVETLGKNTVWNDSYLQEHQGGRYRNNETLVVSDVYSAGLSQCHLEILEQFHIRAYATSPIFVGKKLWGVLAAYQHSQPHEWKKLEIQFLSQIATQLGFAVKQAELLAQAEQKAAELHKANQQQEILFNLVAEIRESLNLDTLFKTTVREVRKALRADRVGIFRFDTKSNYTSGEFVSENVLPDYDSVIAIKVKDHCFGKRYTVAYQQGRIQVLSNIYQAGLKDCHLLVLEQFQIKAQIVVPLMKGKILWGLLCVHQCCCSREWNTSEIQFIRQLAAQFNVALEHSELLEQSRSQANQLAQANHALALANSKLEKLSKLDGLTKIANRRCFDELLEREWHRLQRTGNYLSLVLFDIDNFKDYNDYYGHLAGDECLIKVARAAQAVLKRPTDLLARYGGEEFIVLLPNTDESGAIKVTNLIHKSIEELKISHPKKNSSQDFVTISLGVTTQIPTAKSSAQELVDAADKALYKAKEQGRNRWVCAAKL